MELRTLPLGVDIGATRLRVVTSALAGNRPVVGAVATRDIAPGVMRSGSVADPAYIGALIEEIRTELGVKERRCILGVGEPNAILRIIQFPKMTSAERERAAAFEAQRYVQYPIEEAWVRVHPVNEPEGLYAVGIVRRETIVTRLKAAREGGLRPVAVDYEGFALQRALPGYDAVVDVGLEKTVVYVHAATPASASAGTGGADVTRSIESELAIDSRAAEKRKRIVGTAGAGEPGRAAFLAEVASLLDVATAGTRRVSRIALCGNGARPHGFHADLERATGLSVEVPAAPAFEGSGYPKDVVKAGALDWNLAVGLSLWGTGP